MNSNLHPMLKIVLIKVCCQELWNILLALIFKLSNPRMEILHAKIVSMLLNMTSHIPLKFFSLDCHELMALWLSQVVVRQVT